MLALTDQMSPVLFSICGTYFLFVGLFGYPTARARSELSRSLQELADQDREEVGFLVAGVLARSRILPRMTARRPWLYFVGVPVSGVLTLALLLALLI